MSQFDEDGTEYPPTRGDGEGAPLDSEVDFDDEADDDQLPLDEVEAMEVGVNLDDPEGFPDD